MSESLHWPTVNACLNGLSALCLAAGWVFIKREKIRAHKACMLGAVAFSTLFLVFYLYYHFHAGATRFTGQGWIRPVYFTILISHTLLAAAAAPMVLGTLVHAVRGRFDCHRAWARWTWPVWMYVSVTGIAVYAMLYHLFPSG